MEGSKDLPGERESESVREPPPEVLAIWASGLVAGWNALARRIITILTLYWILPLAVVGFLVFFFFHPVISEDFLFLYFGITSALAVAVWSTLVQTRQPARVVFGITVLFNLAAFSSIIAAIAGPGAGTPALDVSVACLLVGMGNLLGNSWALLLEGKPDDRK